jgi:hypothetical protein
MYAVVPAFFEGRFVKTMAVYKHTTQPISQRNRRVGDILAEQNCEHRLIIQALKNYKYVAVDVLS